MQPALVVREPGGDLVHLVVGGLFGGQLDREGQAVEPAADVGDRPEVPLTGTGVRGAGAAVGRAETGLGGAGTGLRGAPAGEDGRAAAYGPRPVQEEPHGGRDRAAGPRLGAQRRQRQHPLLAEAEGSPGRDQHPQGRERPEQPLHQARAFGVDRVHVVEEQQGAGAGQLPDQPPGRFPAVRAGHWGGVARGLRDGLRDRLGQGRRPVPLPPDRQHGARAPAPRRHGGGEAALAHAHRPGDRHQPARREQPFQFPRLPFPADESCGHPPPVLVRGRRHRTVQACPHVRNSPRRPLVITGHATTRTRAESSLQWRHGNLNAPPPPK
ncbi:hypothetical protein [Streptomyces sp. NPDC005805]|uniref:hypothetical protein n=1 Tax=Streptomyces sp. NPDC005805 TaxID=3157068 RepID=UPI0033E9442C